MGMHVENAMRDGWLCTGEVAQMYEEGCIFIVGRKNDMIIASGFNIYPREIEEVLYQHPKISEAATIGIPDEYRGETVKVSIVFKPGETATSEEITDFCIKATVYKPHKIVEFRNELPNSAVGKILRNILRDEEMGKKNPKLVWL